LALFTFSFAHECHAALAIYSTPAGSIPANTDFGVRVRESGGAWQNLYNYTVKVNYSSPSNASMVNFSFSGTIDMEVTKSTTVSSFEVRPAWMVANAVRTGNVITFSVTQADTFPRKFVVIVNGDLDHCLHVLTNPMETNAPKETDSNVCVVEPGQTTIPLPPGKDTYYFKPGLHPGEHLGVWAEVDLGQTYAVDKITLIQRDYAHRYKVYVRNGLSDYYALAYNGSNNSSSGTVTQTFTPVNGRYVKIQFFENTSGGNLYSTHINEFKVFSGTSQNLASGKFRVGSHAGLSAIVDGNDNAGWNPPSESMTGDGVAGRFWLYGNGQKMYIAGGAVVRGGIYVNGFSNITVSGRGIVDGSKSNHPGAEQYVTRVNPYLNFSNANDTLEGITVLDPPGWTLFFRSTGGVMKNYSSIGWDGNSDGTNLGADNMVLNGIFIRSSDDILAYPRNNLLCKNSVVWCESAHVFFVLGGSNTTFRNIDVLGDRFTGMDYMGVICVQAFGGANIQNITFEDIRVARFRDAGAATVMYITTVLTTAWNTAGGTISNILLKNISYDGTGEVASPIEGAVSGVRVVNYKRPGVACATNASQANVRLGSGAGVTFSCEPTERKSVLPSPRISRPLSISHGSIAVNAAGRHTITLFDLSGAIEENFSGTGCATYRLDQISAGRGMHVAVAHIGGKKIVQSFITGR
jgi:hypothetical protein